MATSKEFLDAELLRLVTAGSVDDGKSTLIGRLLYDTKQILVDQLEHIEDASRRRGHDYVDLALLTDGLRAEREQGITIDVAYRSFVTPRRRFQLADAPGHVQYTRNMVTGASTADVAVILVDARKGVIEQTRRHSYIVSMLELPHVVYAVNKMDLVEFSEERFDEIVRELEELSSQLGLRDPRPIPVSALKGDNVVDRTDSMPWYDGPTLLEYLETSSCRATAITTTAGSRCSGSCARWPTRTTTTAATPGRSPAATGTSATRSSCCRPGLRSTVAAIDCGDDELTEALPGQSVTIRLTDDVDVSRGDLIADAVDPPIAARELVARVCWMTERPLEDKARLLIKQTTRTVPARVDEVLSVVEIETLQDRLSPGKLELNELGVVRFRLAEPLVVDPYVRNRATGAFILIDETTNDTVGAGMVVEAS